MYYNYIIYNIILALGTISESINDHKGETGL